MKNFLLFITVILLPFQLLAQSTNAPLNSDYYHHIDRYEIKSGQLSPSFFSAWKAYERREISGFVDTVRNTELGLSTADRFNLGYLANDNWEWQKGPNNLSKKPFLKHFYRTKSDFYSVNTEDFDLHINPVLYLEGGKESDSDITTFTNTRGVALRGMIDQKVGFYAFIGENQMTGPAYFRKRISDNLVVPHEGFWKGYGDNGVDFFTARGYISFQATEHINIQFGHDRFSIGNGYRSLILSDYAPASLFMKIKTKVWKFNYTNLYTKMTADVTGNATGLTGNGRYPDKYLALHHLSLNIGKKLNIGVFESVIFSNTDSAANNGYELKYLNPVIFYRAIEQQNGSTDNVLLGLDFKWLPVKKIALYGQVVLDEFKLDNIKAGDGWWANKFAVQLGGEYIDAFGVSNLDLQLETNIARPYTYSHGTPYGSYSSYRQPLAHPLSANFKEAVAIARYQPAPKWHITGKIIVASYGVDTTGVNYGGNILLDNTTREMNNGNSIGQGVGTDLLYASLTVSYQWKHNFFIDLNHTYRKLTSEVATMSSATHYPSVALRWNIPRRLNEF